MSNGFYMPDSIKVFAVSCSNCRYRHIWDSCTKYKICDDCKSAVVLRTASYEELREIKKQIGNAPLAFSNYAVYSITAHDVERVVEIRKKEIKQLKEQVEERRKKREKERLKFKKPKR